MSDETNKGSVLLIVFSLVAAVASVFLVIIYASLAVDVIGYMLASVKEGAEGIGAAVALVFMIALLVGMILLFLVVSAIAIVARNATGFTKTIAKVAFIFHTSALVLALITLIVIKILS